MRRRPSLRSSTHDAGLTGLGTAPAATGGAGADRRDAATATAGASPPRSPPGRPASAGPRSPNSSLACESQDSSNDATSASVARCRTLAVADGRRDRHGRCARARRGSLGRRAAAARGRSRRRRRSGVVARERERELARVVDVVDAHRDLVAEVEHVFDPVDALAATELRDVEQAVAAGEDVDERTELGDVHDLAGVLGAELGGGRVEDQLDPAPRLLDRARRPWSRCSPCRRRRRRSPTRRRPSPG